MNRPALLLLACFPASLPALAADWSVTELQLQVGKLDAPTFAAGGGDADTGIVTLQHADGWKYGDNFFFVDRLDDDRDDGFNDEDWYGEFYANFSLGKLSGRDLSIGVLRDVGVVLGINMGADAEVVKYLPGIRLAWNIPGFAFLQTDITAYIDDSEGVAHGGAPSEDDSFMVDFSWAYPIRIGTHRFSIEGHAEYIGERDNEFGQPVEDWILAQPQFRYDIGYDLFCREDTLFVGVEYQYWRNKLGDRETDEHAAQALMVWRF
jgi:nucleoside-specific outer membrane channel protein Tsx